MWFYNVLKTKGKRKKKRRFISEEKTEEKQNSVTKKDSFSDEVEIRREMV